MPKTNPPNYCREDFQRRSSSFCNRGVIPTIRESSVLALVWGMKISPFSKFTSRHFILKISLCRIAVSNAQMSMAFKCDRLSLQAANSRCSSSNDRTWSRSTSAEIEIIPETFPKGFWMSQPFCTAKWSVVLSNDSSRFTEATLRKPPRFVVVLCALTFDLWFLILDLWGLEIETWSLKFETPFCALPFAICNFESYILNLGLDLCLNLTNK